jgi:hypothetical protein
LTGSCCRWEKEEERKKGKWKKLVKVEDSGCGLRCTVFHRRKIHQMECGSGRSVSLS